MRLTEANFGLILTTRCSNSLVLTGAEKSSSNKFFCDSI